MAETKAILHTTDAAQEAAFKPNAAAALDQAIQDLRDIVWTASALQHVEDPPAVPLPEPQVSPVHAISATQPLWRRLHLLAVSTFPGAIHLRPKLDEPPGQTFSAVKIAAGQRSAA